MTASCWPRAASISWWCAHAPPRQCKTVLVKDDMQVRDTRHVAEAQLMFRAERSCATELRIRYETPGRLALAVGAFEVRQPAEASELVALIPAESVAAGVNVLTLTDLGPYGALVAGGGAPSLKAAVAISKIELEPRCEAAPAPPAPPLAPKSPPSARPAPTPPAP